MDVAADAPSRWIRSAGKPKTRPVNRFRRPLGLANTGGPASRKRLSFEPPYGAGPDPPVENVPQATRIILVFIRLDAQLPQCPEHQTGTPPATSVLL